MKELHDIINKYRLSGKTFSVQGLLEELEQERIQFDREAVADAIQHYFPLHFHFTPREISYLLSELAFNYSPKSIADIACGIGSNLAVCDYAAVRVGYEINQEIVDLARYFNPGIEVIAADSVYLDEAKKFDAIISTLPFGGRYKVGPNHESLEISLINKAINLLSDNGAVLVVVPKNLLTSKDGSKLRHRIINEFCLDAVIEIPTDKSWTTIDSAILIFRKGKKNEKVYFGLYQGEPTKMLSDFNSKTGDFWVNYERLQDRLDRYFFHPKHDDLRKYLDTSSTKSIEDLAEVVSSPIRGKEMMSDNGEFMIVRVSEYSEEGIKKIESTKYFKGQISNSISRAILVPGDIIIGLRFNNNKLYTYKETDTPAIIGSGVAILRSHSGEYIKTYLSTEAGKNLVMRQADMKSVGSVIPNLPLSRLKQIQIPIIPINELNVLSDKVIEEAPDSLLNEIKSELRIVRQTGFDKDGALMQFLENRFNKIETQLKGIDSKVDRVLSAINEIQDSLKEIKNLPREEEDKLRRIYRSIDEKLNTLSDKEKDIDFYIEEVKIWFEYWEQLDEASKQFLPSAEYLFDSISRVGSDDFSPFIIQYCRALENELLKKLFEAYHEDIQNRMAKGEIDELTKTDKDNSDSKAHVFARFVIRNNSKYTLGQMKWVIALTHSGSNTLSVSPLIKDFREFILRYYQEQLLEKEYINLVGKISDDYRNKSAHPYIMTLDAAKECQVLIRDCLMLFFENKKK